MLTTHRIYKSKYTDDPPSLDSLGKDGLGKGPGRSRTPRQDTAEFMKDTPKDKPAGRSRARSIWGRRKEKS